MHRNKINSKFLKKSKQRKRNRLQLLEKNKTPMNPGRLNGLWKGPGILSVAGLITIILVIPTLIVAPSIKPSPNQATTTTDQNPAADEIAMGDSPFSVSVMRANSNKVEDVPLETYVSRVVASEMPASFELEALKAQTLAARTFIVSRMLHNKSDDANVSDTVNDQVYHNEQELKKLWGSDYDQKMKKIKEAVASTTGEILTYKNRPITPAFFSTSNGYTENSEDYWQNKVPYLRSVKSPWDKNSPKFLDQKTIPIQQVEKQLGVTVPSNLTLNISRTDGNRVENVRIGDKTFSGREIREKLGLRSSDFSIEQKNDHLIFRTKGFGHGIGMSQYGANGMAKEGKSYQEIVQYYYKGVEVSTVNDTAPTLVAK